MREWLPSPSPSEPEHPDVATIEEMLGDPSEDLANALSSGRKVTAVRAAWICACTTEDESPVWLIVDDDEDGPVWCRVPINTHLEEVVAAGLWAGGHPAPEEVFAWLRGALPEEAILDGGAGDPETLAVLRERVLARTQRARGGGGYVKKWPAAVPAQATSSIPVSTARTRQTAAPM